MGCAEVRRRLEQYGLLLLQDKKLPSVAGIIVGETLSRSWWSHPRAQEIFACLEKIEDEVLSTKLIARKVTFIHRRLWPAIAAIGESNEPWQTRGLTPSSAA